MKVSVIVPMYNVEAYVGACLDSLKAQTLQDMEVILVDDGCTDDTAKIAQSYVDQNPSLFTLFHKENGGLSDARNFGIPHAKGEYIAFLDSDDFVEPTFYEKMLQKIEEGHDIVVCDIEYWYEEAEKRHVMKGLSSWPADTIQKKAMLSPMFAWNKLYKASYFQGEKGYRYPVGTWYEDIPVTTMLFARAKSIGYVEESLVHYRQREGSIMSEKSPRVKEIFGVMELVRKNFKEAGLYEEYYDELEYLHIEHLRLYGMFRFVRSDYWEECFDESEQVMLRNFPNWRGNKYLENLNFKNQLFLDYYSKGTAWIFNYRIKEGE
ncbi:MAG: glycosyltransferase [Solobacterium sp.]|nr:glycosyltransferase [Solobacterium sp.]